MGSLSYEEFRQRAIDIVSQLYSYGDEIMVREHPQLVEKLSQVWAGVTSCGYYSPDTSYNSSYSVWDCALLQQTIDWGRYAYDKKWEGEMRKIDPETERYQSWQRFISEPSYCSILLGNKERHKAQVLEVYDLCEKYFGELSRAFGDGISAFTKELTWRIAEIRGLCYVQFKHDTDFMEAWFISGLMQKIITHSEKDVCNRWWMKQCLHHDLRLGTVEFNELKKLHRKYQPISELSVEDRVLLSFKLLGRHYGEFPHQLQEFKEMLVAWNKTAKKTDHVSIAKVEAAFKHGGELYKKQKRKPLQYFCHLTGNDWAL